MPTLLPAPSLIFDHAATRCEGPRKSRCDFAGDVFDCGPDPGGRDQFRLCRIDAPEDDTPPFADDRDAWMHVVTRARAGSALHQAALDAADDTERMLVEAACGAW